jgi:hypothetical protein
MVKTDPIDMSPPALAHRVEQMRALYKLMVHLRGAKPIDPPRSSDDGTEVARR